MTRTILFHVVLAALVAKCTLSDSPRKARRLFPRNLKPPYGEIADAVDAGRADSLKTSNKYKGPLMEVEKVPTDTSLESTGIPLGSIHTNQREPQISNEEKFSAEEQKESERELFRSRSIARERIAKHLDSKMVAQELLELMKSKNPEDRNQHLWNAAESLRHRLSAAKDMDSRRASLERFHALLLPDIYFPEKISTREWAEALENLHDLAAKPSAKELENLMAEISHGLNNIPSGSNRKLDHRESEVRPAIGDSILREIETPKSSFEKEILDFVMSNPLRAEEVFGENVEIFIVTNFFLKAFTSDALLLTWIKIGFENSKYTHEHQENLEEVYKKIALYIEEMYTSAYWTGSPKLNTENVMTTEQYTQAKVDQEIRRIKDARDDARKRVLHVFRWFSEEMLSSKYFSKDMMRQVVDILQNRQVEMEEQLVKSGEHKNSFLRFIAEDVNEIFKNVENELESKAGLYEKLKKFKELTNYEAIIKSRNNTEDVALHSAALTLLIYNYKLQIILEGSLILDKNWDGQSEAIKIAFGPYAKKLEEFLNKIKSSIIKLEEDFDQKSKIPWILKSLSDFLTASGQIK